MPGVENLSKLVGGVVGGVNSAEAVRSVDYSALIAEVLDADEAELEAALAPVLALDLKNDVVENQIKAIAAAAPKPVAFVLKLLKIFWPKK